jgi:hypothetical protein
MIKIHFFKEIIIVLLWIMAIKYVKILGIMGFGSFKISVPCWYIISLYLNINTYIIFTKYYKKYQIYFMFFIKSLL